MSAGLVALTATSAGAEDNGQEKVGVCHRTDAETNPYVYIEVPADEANGHVTGDAKQHNHKVYWDSAGTWRGVAHTAGQERMDYLAPNGSADCNDTTPTDLCTNIDGVQTTVPAGYTRDANGVCTQQTTTDLCPNIDGVQATVPAGLVVNNQGDCVPPPGPPTDVCPNIPGNQASVPAGFELVNGECAEILGEETVIPKPDKPEPKPDKEPTVKGVQVVAPPAAAPAAAAPTAVAAGLGGPTSSPLQMIAQMLVAGGMLLLMAGAWIGLGRREFGTHEA